MATLTLTKRALEMVCEYVSNHGPDRVMVEPAGESVPLGQAMEKHNIVPSVIFVRNDGWSLGAPAELERLAEAMYPELWIAILRRGMKNRWEIEPYEFSREEQNERKEKEKR